MSDTWYRTPLPPYEDWRGNLWAPHGQCLNPMLGPERPPVSWEDFVAEIQTQAIRAYSEYFPPAERSLVRDYMADWVRTGARPWNSGVSPLDEPASGEGSSDQRGRL